MSTAYILYHRDMDGYLSAYSAYMNLHANGINAPCDSPWSKNPKRSLPVVDHVELISVQYGEQFPDIDLKTEDDLYVLDFSYSREILLGIQTQVRSLTVIDHHKSAEPQLTGLDFAIFDTSKAACVLSCEYFFPNDKVPDFIELVGRYDIWDHDINVKSLNAHLVDMYPTFKSMVDFFDYLSTLVSAPRFESACHHGRNLFRTQELTTYGHVKNNMARVVELLGYKVAFYQTVDRKLIAYQGNDWCEFTNVDVTMAFIIFPDGEVNFSFRSKNGQALELVKRLSSQLNNGGGHPDAAGFHCPMKHGLRLIESMCKLERLEVKERKPMPVTEDSKRVIPESDLEYFVY